MALEKKDYLNRLVIHFDLDGSVHAIEADHHLAIYEDGVLLSRQPATTKTVISDALNGPVQVFLAEVDKVAAVEDEKRRLEAEATAKAIADKVAAFGKGMAPAQE